MEDQLMSQPDGRDNEPAPITIDCCMLYCTACHSVVHS